MYVIKHRLSMIRGLKFVRKICLNSFRYNKFCLQCTSCILCMEILHTLMWSFNNLVNSLYINVNHVRVEDQMSEGIDKEQENKEKINISKLQKFRKGESKTKCNGNLENSFKLLNKQFYYINCSKFFIFHDFFIKKYSSIPLTSESNIFIFEFIYLPFLIKNKTSNKKINKFCSNLDASYLKCSSFPTWLFLFHLSYHTHTRCCRWKRNLICVFFQINFVWKIWYGFREGMGTTNSNFCSFITRIFGIKNTIWKSWHWK